MRGDGQLEGGGKVRALSRYLHKITPLVSGPAGFFVLASGMAPAMSPSVPTRPLRLVM